MTIGARPVAVRDTTLTEGQLCAWQGLMTNDVLLPILPRMDRAGFASIELLDPVAFNSCREVAAEDPWERIRLAARRLDRTPAAVSLAGTYLFGETPAPVDELRRTVQTLARSGISLVQIYDPLNDVERIAPLITLACDAGLGVVGGIVFALGAKYDDPYFSERARTLASAGCQAIALLDFAGILHPERVRDLMPALHGVLGTIPLEIRTHCRSGRAEISCFAALENGATTLHCACEPVAGGDSVPSSDYFMEHLAREGYQAALDRGNLAAVSDYFSAVADLRGFPAPVQRLYDPLVDRHQVPVEMEWQLSRACDDVADARDRAGEPPMAAPLAAQFFGTEPKREPAPARTDRDATDLVAETPLQQLMAELERRPWVRRLRVRKGDFTLETAQS